MASAPMPWMGNSSSSPLYGESSIFCHPMVNRDRNSGVGSEEPCTLNDLTEGTVGEQVGDEVIAVKWIKDTVKTMPRDIAKKLSVQNPNTGMQLLDGLKPLVTTSCIRPDVTVVGARNRLPLLTVEVFSSTAEQTIKKALINVIEQFRILRACDQTVDVCVGFAFPGSQQCSGITKVEVRFDEFVFKYSLVPVAKQNVAEEIKAVLSRSLRSFSLLVDLPLGTTYFVRLSDQECNLFEQGAVQEKSSSCLIIRDRQTKIYWKYNPRLTNTYMYIAFNTTITINYSLRPSRVVTCGRLIFHQFDALHQPLSRTQARRCLASLITQLRRSLDELHRCNIAHMDVRLQNICFTHTVPAEVKLIDLDRCQSAMSQVSAQFLYRASDMYTPTDETWTNMQLDWKAVGLLICFLLDEEVQLEDYHIMLKERKVKSTLTSNDFVKCLLGEGSWNGALYEDFQSAWLNDCNNEIDSELS